MQCSRDKVLSWFVLLLLSYTVVWCLALQWNWKRDVLLFKQVVIVLKLYGCTRAYMCFFLLPKVGCSFLASAHYFERNSKTGHGKTKLIRNCFTRQYFFSCLFSFFLAFMSTVSFQLALLFRSALGLKFASNFTNKHKPVKLPCQSHVNHLHTVYVYEPFTVYFWSDYTTVIQ